MRMPTGSRWASNNYITRCHRWLGLVSSSCSWRTRCQRENQLADWGLAVLSDPRLSSPARRQKKCCYGQKNLGSICSSLSPSPAHLSHTTNINPFTTLLRIKCERYIFIKMCVRSFIEVCHYCWLCFRVYLYMYYDYTTLGVVVPVRFSFILQMDLLKNYLLGMLKKFRNTKNVSMNIQGTEFPNV